MDTPSIAVTRPDGAEPDASGFWMEAGAHGTCPVCLTAGPKALLSDDVARATRTALSASRRTPLPYVRCGVCGTVYAPTAEAPRYDEANENDEPLRFYLEEGAGIDAMIEPLAHLDGASVRHYAEIGCSFGFSLDYTRQILGWDVRGIDPSPLAAAGRDALGLPIEVRYFSEAEPLAPPPVDLLQTAEVIEHITEPHGFMRALLAALDEHGVLVISTPNAAVIDPGSSEAMLLQALQPGVHLTLFTARGLVTLAEAHGLVHHHVQEAPDDVTLFASRHPFHFRADAEVDRGRYIDYLQRRLAHAQPGTPLRRGLLSRLLRELTTWGRFDETSRLLPDLFAEYRACGLDLANPAGLVRPAKPPFNVGTILYCLGMREVIGQCDRRRGIAYLDAAAAWCEQPVAEFSAESLWDTSSPHTARAARWQATAARIVEDPAGEHDRRAADPTHDPLSPYHRRQLFSELVHRGDYTRAAPHYADVAASAATLDGTAGDIHERATGHRAVIFFTLGIFALNREADRPTARQWFCRAIDVAAQDPALEGTRREAAIGLDRATDTPSPIISRAHVNSARRLLGRVVRRLRVIFP